MEKFFAELKRRHMYRVAAAYAVVAWVLLQIVNNVAPGLNLPNWAIAFVIVLLAVGFPVALLFAWIQHIAPTDGSAQSVKTARLDWFLIGALVLVILLLSYQEIVFSPDTQTAQQASTVRGAVQPQGNVSIAVLPFANVSADAGQEFFSDGMTDEITTALAKIADLRVVGRTSAFQFKGERKDLRAIGQSLGATHLIEGSVRKVGDRVRITAQLVQAANGLNMWTNSYDRQLTDVFAIQEEIATAIAGALSVPLGLKQGESLVQDRTADVDSYQQYLRAKALIRSRGIKPITDGVALLEQVVMRDPQFAPAWGQLALGYDLIPTFSPAYLSDNVEEARRIVDISLPKAEAAAQKAIELNPNHPDGVVTLGRVQIARGKLIAAEDLYQKALALDPNNPDVLHFYGDLLSEVGRLKEALAMRQKLFQLEPFVPVFTANTGSVLWLNGQTDAAIAMLKGLSVQGSNRSLHLARIYAAQGHFADAADTVLASPDGAYLPGRAEAAARVLRTAPRTAPPADLPPLGNLGFIYLYLGAPERAVEFYEANVKSGYFVASQVAPIWHASYAPMRKSERFKAFVRAAGLVEYWRAKGWPEFCHPVGADDFVCD